MANSSDSTIGGVGETSSEMSLDCSQCLKLCFF